MMTTCRKISHDTELAKYRVKLSKVKRLPKRTESSRIKYEFVTANRIRTFLLFLCFFLKSSVRFDRKLTKYQN